ncbi:MAG: outer membrane lipoprotein carrier protein LolA [Deltaproteobacteria bacterium]|nr:outer membrane lipoprotein carrier protein LolA [Deltaproteobacteria bacterium]
MINICRAGLILWATILYLAAAVLPAAAQTPQEVIAKVQAQYDKSGGFKAWFKQETRLKGSSQGDMAEGLVHFQKPLKMRWEYKTPPAQRKDVISDGSQVWIYQPQDRIVMVYPLKQVLRSDLVMRFFSGMGQLSQEFKISWHRPPGEGSPYSLNLKPVKPQMELKDLTLTVDPITYRVEGLAFSNALGEETRFTFSGIQMDFKASPGFYTFTPPPGVQVVKETPG